MVRTFNDFLAECEAYEHSREHYEIMKECAEIQLMEQYVNDQIYVAEYADILGQYNFNESYFTEASSDAVETVNNKLNGKKEGLFKRIMHGIGKILETLANWIMKAAKWFLGYGKEIERVEGAITNLTAEQREEVSVKVGEELDNIISAKGYKSNFEELIEAKNIPSPPKVEKNPSAPKVEKNPTAEEIEKNPSAPKIGKNPSAPKIDKNPSLPKIGKMPSAPKLPGPTVTGERRRRLKDEQARARYREDFLLAVAAKTWLVKGEELKSMEAISFKDALKFSDSIGKLKGTWGDRRDWIDFEDFLTKAVKAVHRDGLRIDFTQDESTEMQGKFDGLKRTAEALKDVNKFGEVLEAELLAIVNRVYSKLIKCIGDTISVYSMIFQLRKAATERVVAYARQHNAA